MGKETKKVGAKKGVTRVKPIDKKMHAGASISKRTKDAALKAYGTLGNAIELAVKYKSAILSKEKELKEAEKTATNEL